MAGFFDNLLNLGAAYAQHVGAVRAAIAQPDAEQAVTYLSNYLKGLSDASLQGFKLSVAGLAGSENDASVKQSLQWILANVDALRSGQVNVAVPADPRPAPAHAPAPTSAVHDGEPQRISGTWSGELTNDEGEAFEASFRFSESGQVLYGYNDQRGPREVALTQAGQRIQFVPPGGGVVTIDFDEILSSECEAGYSARYSEQRSSGGVMDQESSRIVLHCKLLGDRLAVVYTRVGQKHTSGSGIMVGGDRAYRAQGTLTRSGSG